VGLRLEISDFRFQKAGPPLAPAERLAVLTVPEDGEWQMANGRWQMAEEEWDGWDRKIVKNGIRIAQSAASSAIASRFLVFEFRFF